MTGLLQDLRYAFRVLGKSPAFTGVAVATLAVGIGLNTTLFTVFNAVALKPIPVRHAGNLVRLERWYASNRLGSAQYLFSWQEYEYLRARSHSLPDMIAAGNPLAVSGVLPSAAGSAASLQPLRLVGQLVSGNYFSALAVTPALGRTFAADENDAPGAHPVAVLSYAFWQRRFNGDPAVVGKFLTLNGVPFTIVGVASPEFFGTANPPQTPDFWAPAMMQAQIAPGQDWLNDPLDQEVQLLGHEVPVASSPRGAAELSVLIRQFLAAHPNPHLDADADPRATGTAITTRVSMQPATLFGNTEDVRFRLIVAILTTVVGMVLLIACANLANMLLARATGRQREIGVRMALGASRIRVVRLLLTESVLLALLGGAAGLIFAIWAADLLWAAVTPFLNNTVFALPTTPDASVLVYAIGVSLATGVVFGLSPALHATRPDIVSALKDTESVFGRWTRRDLRALLVGGQVAVSVVFLISAGLLTRGLIRSQSADPGYETRSVYVMPLDFGSDERQADSRAHRAIDLVRAVPQVQGVALVERPPMMWTWTIGVVANDSTSVHAPASVLANHVSGSYFDAMSIPLMRGRTFTPPEERAEARVAVISDATARALWPGEDPIGRRADFLMGFDGKRTTYEVIGVAADVRTATLSRPDSAFAYLPAADATPSNYWLAIRTRGDARAALAAIGAALVPVDVRFTAGFAPINLANDVVRTQRLIARTFSGSAAALALVALLLAAVGIYGVASFIASQREHEVGVRMALGAQRADVLRLIIGDSLRPVIYGGAVGLLGALAVSVILRATLVMPDFMDVLYGVGSFDPATFVILTGLLALIAFVACYLPALRSARVDPLAALRRE
jgi:putative ABC transport system permease protein